MGYRRSRGRSRGRKKGRGGRRLSSSYKVSRGGLRL